MNTEIEFTEPVPGRGTPESATWFREQLAALGMSIGAVARFMVQNGDDRSEGNIERTLRRMAVAQSRVSGEMRVLLTVLRQHQAASHGDQAAAE